MIAAEEFIRTQTRLGRAALVPEIHLWLADEVTPLWQATEAWLEAQNCSPPYWAFAWPGGQALARYMIDNKQLVAGRHVFDFAAGGGIAALAALHCGAAAVFGNDIDKLACAAMRLNEAANGLADLSALQTSSDNFIGQPLASYDLVVAGDICYDKKMADIILPWLCTLSDAGREVWVADPGRAYFPRDNARFVEIARYEVPTTQDLESASSRLTTLYRLAPGGLKA